MTAFIAILIVFAVLVALWGYDWHRLRKVRRSASDDLRAERAHTRFYDRERLP
jgi:uncharacterized membrane protein YqjE